MQTINKRRNLAFVVWIAILTAPLLGVSTVSAQTAGNTGTVSDAAPNMVRSDGVDGGLYVDGDDCVSVEILPGSGGYLLRTVANMGVCKDQPSYWTPGATVYHRWFTFDFGSPVPPTTSMTPGDLDGNGTAQQLEFAAARFNFDGPFAKKIKTTGSTPVSIFVSKVNPDGTVTQDWAWDIEYLNPATVVVNPDGSRTLSLAQGSAAADVYAITTVTLIRKSGHGPDRVITQSKWVGTYDLPFSVTAQ